MKWFAIIAAVFSYVLIFLLGGQKGQQQAEK